MPYPASLRLHLAALAFATLLLAPALHAATGTWTRLTTDGLWSDPANWSGGIIADGSGFTAKFDTLNPTADLTVRLDSPRTIGHLSFADTTTSSGASWGLSNNGNAANILTLAGTTPIITVPTLGTSKIASISAVLDGTAGFTKAGAGTLALSAANTLSGPVSLTGSLQLRNVNALANATSLALANGATLTLRADAGSTFPLPTITVPAGSTTTLDVNHLGSGTGLTHTLGGTFSVDSVGASTTTVNVTGSNSAALVIPTVTISNSGTSSTQARLVFNPTTARVSLGNVTGITNGGGRDPHLVLDGTQTTNQVTGKIANPAGGAAWTYLTKQDIGTWTLIGAGNDYAGTTAITGGILNVQVNNALGSSNRGTSVSNGATLQIQSATSLTYSTSEALSLNGAGFGGAGALQNVAGNNTFAGLVTLTGYARINSDAGLLTLGNSGTITGATFDLTVGGAGDTRITGILGTTTGGLVKDGVGTLTLTRAHTYTGATTINAGTLALTSTGSLSAHSDLSIAAGATFDISAITSYTLGANATFTANGTLTAVATLKAGSSFDLGTRPVTFAFTPATFTGDTTKPALQITSGNLTLNGPVTVINNGASPLGGGTYRLATPTSGAITGTPTLNGSIGGTGIKANHLVTLQINGGNVELVVENPLATTTTLTRRTGTLASTAYGTPLQFDIAVTPATSSGVVELRSGGAEGVLVGSATLSNGTATITTARTALGTGTYANLVAVYLGSLGHDPGVSASLAPAQIVSPKPLIVTSATGANKFFDGTTSATFNGALSGIEAGDTVVLLGTGTFASSAVGSGIAITTNATLSGASAANYTVVQPTGLTANILSATVWSGTAGNGLWDNGANWSGGSAPSGSGVTANFSGVNITADTTINLNAPLTIGNIVFGDTDLTSPAGWTLANNGVSTNVLTLAGTTPGITVYTLGTGKNVTISANLAGSAGLTKLGAGEVVLTGVNTYSGGTNINEGTLSVSSTGALGAAAPILVGLLPGTATLNLAGGTFALAGNNLQVGRGTSSASLGVVNQSAGAVSFTSGNAVLVGNNGGSGIYNLSGGTLSGFSSSSRGILLAANNNSTGTFNLSDTGTLSLGSGTLMIGRSDATTFNGTATFNQTGGTATIGTLSIGGSAASTGTNAALNLTAGTFSASSFTVIAGAASSSATLNFGGTAQITLPAFPTRVGTVNLTFDFTTGFLTPSASSTSYLGGLTRAFLTANGADFNVPSGRNITVSQAFENAAGQAGTFTKIGVGTLTLTGVSTYTGPTFVNAGTLLVNSPGSLAAASTVIVGADATFGGDGSVPGSITIASGGTLNPGGTTFGTLTLPSAPALAGTLLINLNRASTPSSGKLVIPGPLALGGVLRVVNLGADLQTGDSFTLFNATAYSGSFSSVLLPALGYGLAWNTSQLATTGTVSVQTAIGFTASTTTLSPTTTNQQIHGVGANFCLGPQDIAWSTTNFNRAFTTAGLNISFVRLANSFECELDEPDIFWRGWQADNARFIRLFRAAQPNGLITMSAWSPPASLKSTGSAQGGTLAKTGNAYRYADYGDWWMRSLQNLRDFNPTLTPEQAIPDFISIQNECDFTPGGIPFYAAWQAGNYLNSTETSTKAGYPQALAAVKSAFAANGFGFVKFVGPDTTTASPSVISAYLNNLPANSFAAIAHHPYQGDTNNVGNNTTSIAGLRTAYPLPGWSIYMTEFFGDDSYGPTVPGWMMHALPMHNVFTIQSANTYLMWGLNHSDPTSDTYCALGHYSKFIRPGDWRSAATTTDANVVVSLYRDPVATGLPDQLILVMINKSAAYSYQTIQTSSYWAADPARRAWKVYKTANDGSTQQRLTLTEDLTGASLTGNRNLVLAPYSITTVLINSDAAPSGIDAWRIQYFGTAAATGDAADSADPDGDGENNLFEFATGQSPSARTTRAPVLAATTGLLELTYSRSKSALTAGYGFTVEWSDTLATDSWSTAGVTTTLLTDDGTLQSVKGGVSFTGVSKRFLRLRITKP